MKKVADVASLERWTRLFSEQFAALPEMLIPALEFVQKAEGYLPRAAMTALARYLRVSEAKVFGVASFYSLFHLEPRGRNQITVCRGTACHVRGSGRLLGDLEKLLGVRAGSSTPDMLFSLETVACLGSCALAPVVVKDKVYGRQTTASVKKLVEDIRAVNSLPRSASKSGKSLRGKQAGAGKTRRAAGAH
jgi:NADH-quinone oxidoreductase subunit E